MSTPSPRYPIGIQTFSEIITEGYLYVDKTDLVYNLTHDCAKYVFLSRPRRFGKSLLTSTLRSYFEGRKELFAGLAIEKLETEWKKYPVLHFDMSQGKHMDEAALGRYLSDVLEEWENVYGITPKNPDPNSRLKLLIQHIYEQTGEKVVLLIDEYDAPLLDVVHEDEMLPKLRTIMRNFYSPMKAADPYLRFVFLTGITKFSQMSIFSELNNIANVSMQKKYAAICGFTHEEMLTQMSAGIDLLAEENEMTREEAIKKLKEKYDGYHFSKVSPDIYNPYSLLNCLVFQEFGSYWFASGTPTYLLEMMKKYRMSPIQLGTDTRADEASFDAPTERLNSIIPLLYQSGYYTIKDYNKASGNYTLGIPNAEVRIGMMHSLIPNYMQIGEANTVINEMTGHFLENDIDGAFRYLQAFFKTVPYCNDIDHEGHWQQMLYVVLSLFGAKGDVEVHTADGRVDLAMVMWDKLYLIEVKLNKSAAEALAQIDAKQYHQRFSLYNLPIVKVGVNFSTEERTITEWKVE